MKKHIVYLTSDANRIYLEAGYSQDLALTLFEMQNFSSSFMHKAPRFCRIVHMEEFETFEQAQKRKLELQGYTRMQKDRLIRKYNPNWLNMIPSTTENKKAVVLA